MLWKELSLHDERVDYFHLEACGVRYRKILELGKSVGYNTLRIMTR